MSIIIMIHTEREEQCTQSRPPTTYMRITSPGQLKEILRGSLHDLDIDSTTLTAEEMATLSSFLATTKTLYSLTVWRCDLDDHAVEQLSAELRRNTSLHRLVLSYNPKITDNGASHLATMLTVNNTLQILRLNNCSISDQGVQHLSKGLQDSKSVTELDLAFNSDITDKGARVLSDMIRVNKSLEKLYLEGTSVGEEGAAALMESLQHNKVVTELWPPSSLEKYCRHHSVYDEVKHLVCFYEM